MAMPPLQLSTQASSSASGRQDAAATFGDMVINYGAGSSLSAGAGLNLRDALPFVAVAVVVWAVMKRRK